MRVATLELKQQDQAALSKTANFNRLARVYRLLEWFTFGPFLWRCRCAFLGEMQNQRAALVIGDGDGRFTARLLDQNPCIRIDAVDASDSMLRQLKQHAGRNASRVQAHCADARKLCLEPRAFDLILTHFFLDCLTTVEVETMAIGLRQSVSPDATWVVSEFAIPGNRYGRLVAEPLVTALYLAFGLLAGLTTRRLPEHRQALARAGFALAKQRQWLGGLLVSELWLPVPETGVA